MKHFIRLTDYQKEDILELFHMVDQVQQGMYEQILNGKSVVMFFPETSIRTRVSFEKGIYQLGGQSILFPPEALDKKESLRDVCGYLNQWADSIIIRHRDMNVIKEMATYAKVPVINAMCDHNHPCEMLADLYALSKIRENVFHDRFLFCGENGNIGLAWKEASDVMGFDLEQCCAPGYEIEGLTIHHNILEAIKGKDIVCTDSLPAAVLDDFKDCQVMVEAMKLANKGAILNPCPPFYRGEEVSEEVIASDYFVGYEFKQSLLDVQQAIMIYCLTK